MVTFSNFPEKMLTTPNFRGWKWAFIERSLKTGPVISSSPHDVININTGELLREIKWLGSAHKGTRQRRQDSKQVGLRSISVLKQATFPIWIKISAYHKALLTTFNFLTTLHIFTASRSSKKLWQVGVGTVSKMRRKDDYNHISRTFDFRTRSTGGIHRCSHLDGQT